MLPFAFFVTGAQAGIWEAALSLLNTATVDLPDNTAGKLHFESSNSTVPNCKSSFDFLEMEFSPIELADPNEYFFVSDNTEYVVTRLESSWLLHNVIDDELLMFGLSGECPGDANWYWINTMEKVGDESADFEPEMTAEIVKEFEDERFEETNEDDEDDEEFDEEFLKEFDHVEGEKFIELQSDQMEHRKVPSPTKCKKDMISEPVSITNYILNEFDNGIIFNFYESSNVEINILFPLNLSVNKIKGNVTVKDTNGQTNIVILGSGEIRTLIVFDLTDGEKRMVQSGLVLKLGTTCLN